MKIFGGLKKYTPLFLKKRTLALIIFVVFLMISLFAFRNIFFITLLVVLTAVSKLPEIIWRTINFDMSLFVLVVLGTVYNLPFALIVSLGAFYLALLIKTLIARHMAPEKIIVPPLGYVIIGLLVLPLGYNIFITGMIAAVIYMVIMIAVYSLIYGFQIFDNTIYVVTTLAFNYFLFSSFAPFALAMLKL